MTGETHPAMHWLDGVDRAQRPIYPAIVEALAAAIRSGALQAGDQLPSQRAVAQGLDVDLTTVTRAYAAARTRGLLDGAVGRGTFVRSQAAEDEAGLVDLSMNLPPPPQGVSLAALLRDTAAAVLQRTDPAVLMAYHPGGGNLGQKIAAARWLAPSLGEIAPERVLIAPGAQTGLAAVLGAIAARPGDALVVEPLVYPGLLSLARQMGLRLVVCEADAGGLQAEALERLCATDRPAAIYLVPTLQNPTAVTLDLGRRQAIARIAQAAGVWIIEDDPYARLLDQPLPAIASLAPERTFHLATLSKCLSPGLRTAFLVPPTGEMGVRTAESLRAVALMPSPLITAVVTAWIREGLAEKLLNGVRREGRARRAIAAEILPQARGAPEGIHVWLELPPGADSARVQRLAQDKGLSLVAASAFAAAIDHPEGLRISLGGPAKQSVLRSALEGVAAVLRGGQAPLVVV